VSSAFDVLLSSTPPPQQQCNKAGHRYADCVLVYSSDDILTSSSTTGENGDDPPYPLWNGVTWAEIMGFGPQALSVGAGLIHQLLVETVLAAASTTPTPAPAPRRFATGLMDSDARFQGVVYSLAQCTPDMSAGNCLACLSRLLGMVNDSMALRMGGQIHVMRCNLRYETYHFYNSAPMLRLGAASAPAPTMTVKHKSMIRSHAWLDLS
jgi:hypothetical protein